MDARYHKITRQDPSSDGTYTDHTLSKDTKYCCESFQGFAKKFPSWSYESGKFTITDSISYDDTTQTPISYCPFCGEKIRYKKI